MKTDILKERFAPVSSSSSVAFGIDTCCNEDRLRIFSGCESRNFDNGNQLPIACSAGVSFEEYICGVARLIVSRRSGLEFTSEPLYGELISRGRVSIGCSTSRQVLKLHRQYQSADNLHKDDGFGCPGNGSLSCSSSSSSASSQASVDEVDMEVGLLWKNGLPVGIRLVMQEEDFAELCSCRGVDYYQELGSGRVAKCSGRSGAVVVESWTLSYNAHACCSRSSEVNVSDMRGDGVGNDAGNNNKVARSLSTGEEGASMNGVSCEVEGEREGLVDDASEASHLKRENNDVRGDRGEDVGCSGAGLRGVRQFGMGNDIPYYALLHDIENYVECADMKSEALFDDNGNCISCCLDYRIVADAVGGSGSSSSDGCGVAELPSSGYHRSHFAPLHTPYGLLNVSVSTCVIPFEKPIPELVGERLYKTRLFSCLGGSDGNLLSKGSVDRHWLPVQRGIRPRKRSETRTSFGSKSLEFNKCTGLPLLSSPDPRKDGVAASDPTRLITQPYSPPSQTFIKENSEASLEKSLLRNKDKPFAAKQRPATRQDTSEERSISTETKDTIETQSGMCVLDEMIATARNHLTREEGNINCKGDEFEAEDSFPIAVESSSEKETCMQHSPSSLRRSSYPQSPSSRSKCYREVIGTRSSVPYTKKSSARRNSVIATLYKHRKGASSPSCCGKGLSSPSLLPSYSGVGRLGINFQEAIISGRMARKPSGSLNGFVMTIGAMGSKKLCPQVKLPFAADFYEFEQNDTPVPYVGEVNISDAPEEMLSHPGLYRVGSKGHVQVVVANPLNTAVKVFIVKYDLTEMPCGTKTFLRQKTICERNNVLIYACQLKFWCSSKGKIYLYDTVRVVFSHRFPDSIDECRVEYQTPENPPFFPCG